MNPRSRWTLPTFVFVILAIFTFGLLLVPIAVDAQATPDPIVQTAVELTLRAIYSQTPPTATATRTPVPTRTATPTPLSVGDVISDGRLEVELLFTEVRTANQADKEAVMVNLRYTNLTDSPMEIHYNGQTLRAEDDLGNSYGEYFSTFQDVWDEEQARIRRGEVIRVCMGISYDFSGLNVTLPLEPGETFITTLYIHPEGAAFPDRCDVSNYTGRVDPNADWVDFNWFLDYDVDGGRTYFMRIGWRILVDE